VIRVVKPVRIINSATFVAADDTVTDAITTLLASENEI
jgi:hypothetical protein